MSVTGEAVNPRDEKYDRLLEYYNAPTEVQVGMLTGSMRATTPQYLAKLG